MPRPQGYASNQPEGYQNHIKKVAVAGATGNLGKWIVPELLKKGIFDVTAIVRPSSTAKIPDGVKVARCEMEDPSSLATALSGQDALIVIMPGPQQAVIGALYEAAAKAGVPWVVPNEWGGDPTQEALNRDSFLGAMRDAGRAKIDSLGVSAWVGVACSFWYEFSLAGSAIRYGFDFPNKKVTFYDDGKTKINTSTFPQVGRAVANLLALPVLPKNESDKAATLSQYANKTVYVSSFLVSQKDMFDSVLRVTGDKAEDWSVDYQPAKERYDAGVARMKTGDMSGFGQALYARAFYADGSCDYESRLGLSNDVLGLPKENLDEFTKIAVEKALDPNRIPY